MEKVAGVKKKGKRKESRYGKRYGLEFKLRCVKLRLEEGLPISLLSKEGGASKDVIRRWVKAYQEWGEAGVTESSGIHRESTEASLSFSRHVVFPLSFLIQPWRRHD